MNLIDKYISNLHSRYLESVLLSPSSYIYSLFLSSTNLALKLNTTGDWSRLYVRMGDTLPNFDTCFPYRCRAICCAWNFDSTSAKVLGSHNSGFLLVGTRRLKDWRLSKPRSKWGPNFFRQFPWSSNNPLASGYVCFRISSCKDCTNES